MSTEDAQAAEKVALTDAEREALGETDERHEYPTETDDGLVMRCRCGATPPGHLLGEQVDEAFWLWRHRQAEKHATVERIVAVRVAEAVDRERAAWADVEIEAFGRGVAWAGGDDIKAEVWDEGYLVGWDDRHADEDEPLPAGEQHDSPNPHRASADDTEAGP